MRFKVRHLTTYRYDRPVRLGPQVLRLRPRDDGTQRLVDYRCEVDPAPSLRSRYLDLEGNPVEQLWFLGETTALTIDSRFEVETTRANPFDFLPDGPDTGLPLRYPDALRPQVAAYRDTGDVGTEVVRLGNEIAAAVRHEPVGFLSALCRWLHEHVEHVVRETGAPQAPALTLERRRGACRDVGVLFMAVCRGQGFAARYVSGYQARAAVERDRRYLHAWPEVYLPGGGWRGFDPTHGSAVADSHVAVAAARRPEGAAPVSGSFAGEGARAELGFDVRIEAVD